MTKAYALRRLLEHGPMTRSEIVDCTGWSRNSVAAALNSLRAQKLLRKSPVNRCVNLYRVVIR